MSDTRSPRAAFGELSDQEWLAVLNRSIAERVVDGTALPAFPADEIQIRTVGSANAAALAEGFLFYTFVKEACARHGVPLRSQSRVLDFGIGWGRITRFFLKDVEPAGLYGADVDAGLIQTCRETAVPATIAHVDPRGALPYEAGMFNVAIAYSVFTHLPEPVANIWLAELARVLAPKGLLIATVQPPRTLAMFASIDPDDPEQHFWHRRVAARVRRHPECAGLFAERGFAYLPSQAATWDDPSETFGNAFVSPAYVRRTWGAFFDVLAYDDESGFAQAVVIARAR